MVPLPAANATVSDVPVPSESAPLSETLSDAQRRRGLAVLFGSTFVDLVGWFMLMPLLAVVLAARGHGAAFIGAFAATAWLGILLATPFVARLVERLGRVGALWLSAAVPAVCSLGYIATAEVHTWFVLSFVSGLASALRWIVAEALVAELAPARNRGRWVGLWQTMVGATFVVGPLLLLVTGTDGVLPFAVSAALLLGSLLVLPLLPALGGERGTADAPPGLRGIVAAVRAAPAVMIAGFVGGFFESGLTGLLPVWGLALGWSAALAAMLVSASGLGSSLAMVPVGEAADRLGRRPVFVAMAAATLAAALLMPWVGRWPPLAWALAFAWGGAGGALYTLAMLDIGSRLRGVALVNATAVLVLAYTTGGVVAPLAGGAAMQYLPAGGFAMLLVAVAAFGLLTTLRADDRTPGVSGSR